MGIGEEEEESVRIGSNEETFYSLDGFESNINR